MLPLLLFAASLLPAQQASMECVNTGDTTATTATQPVSGPGGAAAVLKVSTTDDASKNSHECWAEYKLVVTSTSGRAPAEVDVDTSDAEYGRNLSLRLAGFSQDGKRVLGIVAEGGKYPTIVLFDYHAGDAVAQLVDLNMLFARITPRSCTQTLAVIGTMSNGAIVVESSSEKACGTSRRWLVHPSGSKARPLPQGAAIQSLYQPNPGPR